MTHSSRRVLQKQLRPYFICGGNDLRTIKTCLQCDPVTVGDDYKQALPRPVSPTGKARS